MSAIKDYFKSIVKIEKSVPEETVIVESPDDSTPGTVTIEKECDCKDIRILINAGRLLALLALVVSIIDLVLTIRRVRKSGTDCCACDK